MDFTRRKRRELGLDMTPMIDCVFQLLIFFLLSSSFLTPSLELALPKSSVDARDTPAALVVVSLDAKGRLYLNKQETADNELENRLHKLFGDSNKREVIFRADRTISYERVFQVICMLQRSGAKQVHLAHDEESVE